jgi:uncharacterized protein Smg (DUF494 family)
MLYAIQAKTRDRVGREVCLSEFYFEGEALKVRFSENINNALVFTAEEREVVNHALMVIKEDHLSDLKRLKVIKLSTLLPIAS